MCIMYTIKMYLPFFIYFHAQFQERMIKDIHVKYTSSFGNYAKQMLSMQINEKESTGNAVTDAVSNAAQAAKQGMDNLRSNMPTVPKVSFK